MEASGNGLTPTFLLLSPADIEALPDLEYLIEGILPASAFGVLSGPPGAGKSFVALSIALAVASGTPWVGREVRQGKVLYVAAEGVLGMKRRLQAYRARFDLDDDQVRFIRVPFDVRAGGDVGAIIATLREANFAPSLIIIDTLARVAVGAEENSAKDMGQVVDGFETLKRETGATVLVVHHTRKNDLIERGSSALRGAADVMIMCEGNKKDNGVEVALKCDKMKDDEPFADIGLKLEKVALPGGKSSLVLGGQVDLTKTVAGHQQKIVELLQERFAEKGATHKDIKDAFVAVGGGSASTFDRAWRKLNELGGVRQQKVDGKDRYFAVALGERAADPGWGVEDLRQTLAEMRACRDR